MKAKDAGFDKYGPKAYKNTPVKELAKLHQKIQRRNIYADKNVVKISELIQQTGMTVVFTDCIDKPWEFNTYAPYLKLGDVLAVHDWDRAIKDEWVKDTMESIHPYRLLYEEERIELNTLTRFFLKE
jgi:hypothetical protein